jgi:hypothetical protein
VVGASCAEGQGISQSYENSSAEKPADDDLVLLVGDESDARLRDDRDVHVWFVEEFEEFLRNRRTVR